MKLCRKISGLIILILITLTLSAQNDGCNIRKTFPVKKGTTLMLSNKYGDVNIITGKDDSLTICGTITIEQDNKELVKKNIKLIKININKIKDAVYISTSYDNDFFSEESRKGRKRFSVDYFIKMPAYINIGISDEFGNISVDELSGSLNLKLSQGTLIVKKLTRGNLKPINSIYADHCKIEINDLNWMNLNLLACSSVYVEKGQAMTITSSISKITLGDISSLVCNSKSDNYNIKSINNILSESTYSEYEIGRLNGQLKAKAIYGIITISDLNKSFSSIDIVSGQAQIIVRTGADVSFKTDINAIDAQVSYPESKYPGIIKTENNYSTTLQGIAGADKETKSLITIRTTAGKLTIQ